ncbi:MAG: hypothetical protein C4558_06095 [Dehalococcoidia bacterium]|nr:MAG: hypothetical protein C4558_06095 [Dehalococcoidia bacterium]
MTTASSNSQSMKFALHEVLSGMLASVEQDRFTDDVRRLAVMFEGLATTVPLFAPMAAGVDPEAVAHALKTLEDKAVLEHANGEYVLTEAGRAHCVSAKRTLFNRSDQEQLETAAKTFATL